MNDELYNKWLRFAKQALHKHGVPQSKLEPEEVVSEYYLKQAKYIGEEKMMKLSDALIQRGMNQIVGDFCKKRSYQRERSIYDVVDENSPNFNVDEILTRLTW